MLTSAPSALSIHPSSAGALRLRFSVRRAASRRPRQPAVDGDAGCRKGRIRPHVNRSIFPLPPQLFPSTSPVAANPHLYFSGGWGMPKRCARSSGVRLVGIPCRDPTVVTCFEPGAPSRPRQRLGFL